MKTKLRKSLNILLRILILAATYGFLYRKILHISDWQHQYSLVTDLLEKPEVKTGMVLVVILMLVNWGIESFKWRFMIRKIERVSFLRSVMAVFTGASISFFTPNRTGEYIGRVFILDKASHVDGILITILGSMCQLLITILAGTLAMLLFIPGIPGSKLLFSGHFYWGFAVMVIFIDLVLVFLVLNARFLSVLRDKLLPSKFKRFRRHLAVFSEFRPRDILKVTGMSLLRYIVFTTQFLLLLQLFSVPVPLFSGIIIIALVFLILSVVPTVTLTELGVRGSAAIYLFGIWYGAPAGLPDPMVVGILAATTLLWVINLAVPAVIGTFFVFRLNFFRKNSQVV